MAVANAGEIRTGEPAALDFPICFWMPSPPREPCIHDQTSDILGLFSIVEGNSICRAILSRYVPGADPMISTGAAPSATVLENSAFDVWKNP